MFLFGQRVRSIHPSFLLHLTNECLFQLNFSDEQNVPLEILARGEKGRRAYAEALKDGKEKVYTIRVMLVGQERVGKTSLKRSLLGEK